MRPVEHAVLDKIERGGRLCVDDFQVEVDDRGRTLQRQPLQRMAGFQAYGTEANFLGNQ